MSPKDPKSSLDIAIVGGGIAGVVLTIAILKHCPHITVTLYESAAAFGEIGAGVGFQPVMVRTMGLIDPRIEAAFHRCNKDNEPTDPPRWFTVRVGDSRKGFGKDGVVQEATNGQSEVRIGEELFAIPCHRGPRGGVHRAHFLNELVKLIPEGMARFRKRLVDIKEADDGSGQAVLHFADATTAQHDAVLGCDGIKSRTRALVLGDTPVTDAVFSGKYAYRGLIAMATAVEILGDSVPKTAQMFLGYHGHVLTFPIANGTIMNVVAFSSQPSWTRDEWVIKSSREEMLEDYKEWSPTVCAVLKNMESTDVWALFNHLPAPTYYIEQPLVCLVGDAAHASTPHQGAGAGMCIEDAYILSALLKKCESRKHLGQAFQAYNVVRYPRTQKLVRTSREAGMLWDFEGEGINDDIEALKRDAVTRMAWIWDYDIQQDLDQAEKMLDQA